MRGAKRQLVLNYDSPAESRLGARVPECVRFVIPPVLTDVGKAIVLFRETEP